MSQSTIVYYDPNAERPTIYDNTDGQLSESDYHTCDQCDNWITRDYRYCGNDVCLTELAKQHAKEEANTKAKARAEKARIREEKAKARAEKARIREEKKAEDMIANPIKYYKRALKKLSWGDGDTSFYDWLAVQAKHTCAPNHAYLKGFYEIWTGRAPGFATMMDSVEFDRQKQFYIHLAQYKNLM